MKFFGIAVFFAVVSSQAFAATLTTENLALRLWNVYDKATNASYVALDNYRLKLDSKSPAGAKLADPETFKKYQTILRNRFIDRVTREFSRKEIINLTAIYKRPEMAKLRIFTSDFFDKREISSLFDAELLLEDGSNLPPLPPPPSK